MRVPKGHFIAIKNYNTDYSAYLDDAKCTMAKGIRLGMNPKKIHEVAFSTAVCKHINLYFTGRIHEHSGKTCRRP